MFITSKYKFYAVYLYLKADIKIEYDVELNKYIYNELDHLHYGSIHPQNTSIAQSIIKFIPSMDK